MLDRIIQDALKRNNIEINKIDPVARAKERLALEKRNKAEAAKNTDAKALRLTNVGTFIMSNALNTQLRSYAQEHNIPISRLCVRAIAEVLDNPSILRKPALSPYAMAPSRPVMVSFIFPKRYPNIRTDAVAMTKREKIQLAMLYRRAIYEYTKSHKSTDKEEALQALADAWL